MDKTTDESKHTPGPWDWTDGEGDTKLVFAAGDLRFGYVRVNGEANARLIAAAPTQQAEIDRLRALNAELLQALEAAVKEVAFDARHDQNLAPIEAKIRAAIAHAKGQEAGS